MQKEYDLSKMKSRPNPYAARLKQQITLHVSEEALTYFQRLSEETGVPLQNLIDLYLRDCAASGRKLELRWAS